MFSRNAFEMRVLILAPIGRDAVLLAGTLKAAGIDSVIARDADALVLLLAEGAGAVILVDEALTKRVLHDLTGWLAQLPPWSDLPFLVLTSSGVPTRDTHRRARDLQVLGNLTLIERPMRSDTIRLASESALRARKRQYEVRDRQEALVQANADLEQFAHSASHDLREPLRTIGIFSDLLTREFGNDSSGRPAELLHLIRGGVARMEFLLNDLLSYAHASSISVEELPPISALDAVRVALDNLHGAIQECGAEVDIGELPAVRVRESHLVQIFQNLLGNAIKYRRDGHVPAIKLLACKREEHFWQFTISDNGIGILPIYHEAIFGVFKRLHPQSRYSGTGMGLAICKRIVERYGGSLWVESEYGAGSRFTFSIPE